MSSVHKAFAGMTWSVVVNVVNAIYGFIATPLLIHYFGKDQYGLIALASSVNAYMGLMDMGLSSTNVRFFANWLTKGEHEKVKKLMQTCTAFYGTIGIINALVLIIVSFYSAHIFNVTPYQDAILKKMLYILAGVAVINWYTSCFGQIISATENVAWVQKRTLVTKILMIGVVILTLVLKLTIIQYFVGIILAGLCVLPVTIRKVKKEAPFVSFMAKFDGSIFKEILPYSLGIFSFGIFQYSYRQLQVVIVGMQGAISSVTDFGVMTSIASLVSMVGGVFIQSLLPSSSRIVAKGDKDAYYRVAYKGTHYVTIILCFCAFGLMTVDADLIMIYVGKDFLHLTPWLNIWLFLTITSNGSCISSLILGGSNVKPLAYSSAVASVLAICGTWFAVPYFQAGGVVIGMVIYNAIQQIFYYCYYWRKDLKIDTWRIFVRTDLPFITLGLGLTFILKNLPHFSNNWVNVFFFGLIFAVIYLTITYLISSKEDRNFIFKLILRK
ncbi:MAG: hypothetical protein K2M41_04510 [Muribaculaceae bacterium]|nr:hypothetical protein [Muribaculaceae bacterium]